MKENKIGLNAKKLIISDLIYILTSIFIDTFLVAYLLKITNDNLIFVALYYIIVFSLRCFGNLLIGMFVKAKPHKSKIVVSIGIVLRAIFILTISILAANIKKYIIFVAILYSVSETFYWCAHELLYIELTNNNNRKSYMSIKKILSKLVNIVAPIILGSTIELYSFNKIAIYVFLFSIIQILLIFSIKINIKNNGEKYHFFKFLDFIKANKIKTVDYYSLSGILLGILENSVSTLIIYITIKIFKTSFNLGMLTTIFAVFSMISLFLYKKYYTPKNSYFFLSLCCTIYLTGVLGLLIEFNEITLIIYNFAYIVAYSIFDVIYNTLKGDLVKKCGLEKYRIEYIGLASISILIGRIIGYLLIFIVAFINNLILLKVLLAILTITAPIYCYVIYKIERKK